MTEEKNAVEIPAGAILPCPLVKFKNRRAQKCAACPHFRGLEQVSNSPVFSAAFRVACAHPVTRQMAEVTEE